MKKITTNEICKVTTEGLVLQGCGGEPQEWLDGINKMLTEADILQNGAKFTEVSIFEHEGLTNLLFNMEMWICIWANLPCGDWEHMSNSAENG